MRCSTAHGHNCKPAARACRVCVPCDVPTCAPSLIRHPVLCDGTREPGSALPFAVAQNATPRFIDSAIVCFARCSLGAGCLGLTAPARRLQSHRSLPGRCLSLPGIHCVPSMEGEDWWLQPSLATSFSAAVHAAGGLVAGGGVQTYSRRARWPAVATAGPVHSTAAGVAQDQRPAPEISQTAAVSTGLRG